MTQQVVFYSWQSWTDGSANRNFIEDCLERAIKDIRNDDSLRLDPVIDRDVQGVPGSADIAATILGKIAEADVFIADVSFVDDPPLPRRLPNPNVLVELGYALGSLGEEKLVCVHNLATGRVEDLPFDIRGRPIATYHLVPKGSIPDESHWLTARAEQRKQFVSKLKAAILAVLSAPDPALTDFVNEMVEKLIVVLIFGGEVDDRQMKPGSEVLYNVLASVGPDLRAMACREEAAKLNLSQRVEEVAAAIDKAVQFHRLLCRGNHEEYVGLIKRAEELTRSLKKELCDSRAMDRKSLDAIHRELFAKRRQLENLVDRLPELLKRPGGLDEIYETTDSIGLNLCRYGELSLEPIQKGLPLRLAEIGRKLHLVGMTIEYVGHRGRQKTSEMLPLFSKEFAEIVDGLPKPR